MREGLPNGQKQNYKKYEEETKKSKMHKNYDTFRDAFLKQIEQEMLFFIARVTVRLSSLCWEMTQSLRYVTDRATGMLMWHGSKNNICVLLFCLNLCHIESIVKPDVWAAQQQ